MENVGFTQPLVHHLHCWASRLIRKVLKTRIWGVPLPCLGAMENCIKQHPHTVRNEAAARQSPLWVFYLLAIVLLLPSLELD